MAGTCDRVGSLPGASTTVTPHAADGIRRRVPNGVTSSPQEDLTRAEPLQFVAPERRCRAPRGVLVDVFAGRYFVSTYGDASIRSRGVRPGGGRRRSDAQRAHEPGGEGQRTADGKAEP